MKCSDLQLSLKAVLAQVFGSDLQFGLQFLHSCSNHICPSCCFIRDVRDKSILGDKTESGAALDE